MTLARQIRALRKQRGWSQAQLAELLNTKQSRVSAMENEEYGAFSIASLKDLARVFDVYLNVRFTSFADLLSQVDRTSMDELSVQRYSEDPGVIRSETFSVSATAAQKVTQDTRRAVTWPALESAVLTNDGTPPALKASPSTQMDARKASPPPARVRARRAQSPKGARHR